MQNAIEKICRTLLLICFLMVIFSCVKKTLDSGEAVQVFDFDKGLVAYYPLDGDFKDKSANGYDLKAFDESTSVFTEDEYIKKGPNQCYGPIKSGDKATGASSSEIPSNDIKGLTLTCFVAKPGGNNYRAFLLGFGDEAYNKSKALLALPYGVLNVGAGNKKMQRWKRFNDGLWHHLALVFPPRDNGNEFSAYLDGSKVFSGPINNRLDSYGDFKIAHASGPQREGFKLDEVRVYQRALSENEIKAMSELKGKKQEKSVSQNRGSAANVDFSERRVKPEDPVVPKGELKVYFLDNKWICVVGDYNDFLDARFVAECGKFLKKIEESNAPEWSRKFHYNFAYNELLADYIPKIKNSFDNIENFSIKTNGEEISIAEKGYWVNAQGVKYVPAFGNKKKKQVRAAVLAFFAYLRAEKKFINGKKYTISSKNGENVDFVYNDKKNISRAIKVNQVAYSSKAGRKYAYLGMWLGDLGAMDISDFTAKKFYLIDESDNKSVFSGHMTLRDIPQRHKGVPINGEEVLQMDFSDFSGNGKYHIYIPGVGRSWSFRVSPNAAGEPFYIHSRGLYHQRCGIAKKKPYTNWEMGACHEKSYKGSFPSNDKHYCDEKLGCFTSAESGKFVRVKPFDLITATRGDEVLEDLKGGWHDAADYDRRPYHFQIIRDLLSAYLMFPDKFTDAQLNIPESGNNIPDIIDEAAWGMEVWRKAQKDDGGVGTWLEATSHPKNPDPSKDKQKYYLSAPSRESTLEYAQSAAMLAMAYRKCGNEDKAELYLNSAVKAFDFAMNPANRLQKSYTIEKRGGKTEKINYAEPEKLNSVDVYKAAYDLKVLSKDKKYDKYLSDRAFKQCMKEMNYPRRPYFLLETLLNDGLFPERKSELKEFIIRKADERLDWQEMNAYRTVNWPPGHGYYNFMAWGACHPFRKGKYFTVAWYLTENSKYRDALFLLNDWMCGANPMGRTITTGLGKVSPVSLLSLASSSDRIPEPIPGISVYTFTGSDQYQSYHFMLGLVSKAREDHGWDGMKISLAPKSLVGKIPKGEYDDKKCREKIKKIYPIWRRHCCAGGWVVSMNEFTVWETISPAAAATGVLLPDGWKPSKRLIEMTPEAETKKDLKGYLFMP